jgi:hypothetical protein
MGSVSLHGRASLAGAVSKKELAGGNLSVWEFLKAFFQTTATNVVIVCVAITLIVVYLALWAENSSKDISVWGINIKNPDSNEVQACRTIQTNASGQIAVIERERDAAYKGLENDHNLLQEAAKLLLEARTRDRERGTDANAQSVSGWITDLSRDSAHRDEIITWAENSITAINAQVNKSCGAILESSRAR